MTCPRCFGTDLVHDGTMSGKTRFKCKSCNYHFTDHALLGKTQEQKQLALRMFVEGLGFRSIGRVLNVSNVAVLNWIRDIGQKLAEFDRSKMPTEAEDLRQFLLQKKHLLQDDFGH